MNRNNTNTMKIRFLAIIAGLLFSGCAVVNRAVAPWTTVVADGPWSAAGQHAVLESRAYWSSIMAAAMSSDERLRAPDGRTADAQRTVNRLITYFEKKGSLQNWPETDAHINSKAVVLAPFYFHLVSVFPTVVIMSAHDFGAPRNRCTYEIVGLGTKGSLGDARIMNYIEISTIIPASNQLYWASADLRVPISPIEVDARGEFTIQHPKVLLVGRRAGDSFIVERKK
ncbi:MAG: hypothetical protein LBC18_04880 [Opitutaceae bacterium]|nr:hypothetical protein [Opitutaceae bacterium]